jgi:hypothetical protein
MRDKEEHSRLDDQPIGEIVVIRSEPMESAMGGAGDISSGMGGGAGGDIGEMAEAGLVEGVDPRAAIGLPSERHERSAESQTIPPGESGRQAA